MTSSIMACDFSPLKSPICPSVKYPVDSSRLLSLHVLKDTTPPLHINERYSPPNGVSSRHQQSKGDWIASTDECQRSAECSNECNKEYCQRLHIDEDRIKNGNGLLAKTTSPGNTLDPNEQRSGRWNQGRSHVQWNSVTNTGDHQSGLKTPEDNRPDTMSSMLPTSLRCRRNEYGEHTPANKWQQMESGSLAHRTTTSAPAEQLFKTSMSLKEVQVKKRPSILAYNWNHQDDPRSTEGERFSERAKDSRATWTSPWLEAAACGSVSRCANVRSDGKCDDGLKGYRNRKCEADLNDDHKCKFDKKEFTQIGDGKCDLDLKERCDGKRHLSVNIDKYGNDSSDKLNHDGRRRELDLRSATNNSHCNHASLCSPSAADQHCQTNAGLMGRNSTTLNHVTESRDMKDILQPSAHPVEKGRASVVHELRQVIENLNDTMKTGGKRSMPWHRINSNGVGEKQAVKPDLIEIANGNGHPRESGPRHDVTKVETRDQGINGGAGPHQQQVQQQTWLKSSLPSSKTSSTQRDVPRRRQALDDQWWIRGHSSPDDVCHRCACSEANGTATEMWSSDYEQTGACTRGRRQENVTRGIYGKSSGRLDRPDMELSHDVSTLSSALDLGDTFRHRDSVNSARKSDVDAAHKLRPAKSASQLHCAENVQFQLQEQSNNDATRGVPSHRRSHKEMSTSSTSSSQLSESRETTGLDQLNVTTNFHELQVIMFFIVRG